jgi:hypothetical protein
MWGESKKVINMGGRKVCFISDAGQVATCIRDDENCSVCEHNRERYEKIQEHVSLYARSRKSINILNQTVYGIRDLASSFSRVGNKTISEELQWRANNIEEAIDVLEHDINKVAREEFERIIK